MFAKIKAKFAAIRERLLGWKTIIWNAFIGLMPVILVSLDKLQALDLTPYMTPWMGIFVGFLIAAVGTYLRYISVGPVGSKGTEEPTDPAVKAGD